MNKTTTSPSAGQPAVESQPALPDRGRMAERRHSGGLRRIRFLANSLPTLLILAVLAGLAWWGHHYGWRLPKFSELAGKAESNEVAWCDEHGVPEADCIACNPDLMPKGQLFGWCSEHGVHECVLDHPELAQLPVVPEITLADLDRAARAIAARPRTENDPGCKMHLRRIQFPSIEAVNRVGIDIALVEQGPLVESIQTNGQIVYDPTRIAHVSSRAGGTLWRVEKNVGDRVEEGELLALVDAVKVGQLKSQLLQLLSRLELDAQTLDRMMRLGGDVVPEKKIQEARAARMATEFELDGVLQALSNLGLPVQRDQIVGQPITNVRANLRYLGLPIEVIDRLDPDRDSANLIPVFSPRRGIVVERDAVDGEVIQAGKRLFTVVDTGRMWLMLNLRAEEAERVKVGQKIVFQPDGSDLEVTGQVTWISTTIDDRTRTVQVRGELDNSDGLLRNETFGSGQIVLREEFEAILVPREAIHWEGCCHVAFVRDRDYFKDGSYKVFHARSVRPGAVVGDQVEVIAGLLPGEVVATEGSGILRAELLKGNLGAG